MTRVNVVLLALLGGLLALLLAACGTDAPPDVHAAGPGRRVASTQPTADGASPGTTPRPSPDSAPTSSGLPVLPPASPRRHHAASQIFSGNRFLVAYYGTPGTDSLGVLGATSATEMAARLRRAASAFAGPRRPVQTVFEIIVRVADPTPGPGRLYSHDIPRSALRPYLSLARKDHARVVLDIQPGRSEFLPVVKHWAWALRDADVGLALDPEWRMHGDEVPGRTVGWVDAPEINRVSAWLSALQRRDDLPEKLFLLHEFRTDMIRHLDDVVARPGLAQVQHVDGFGTPGQKLSTYHAVQHHRQFFMGFKLFYRADVDRMSAAAVQRIRPGVRFVSFQ